METWLTNSARHQLLLVYFLVEISHNNFEEFFSLKHFKEPGGGGTHF